MSNDCNQTCQNCADGCDDKCSGSVSDPDGGSASCPSCGARCRSCNDTCSSCSNNCKSCQCAGSGAAAVLLLTYWCDSGLIKKSTSRVLQVTGHCLDTESATELPSTFTLAESLTEAADCAGPVAITTRASGLRPGRWKVFAGLSGDDQVQVWSGTLPDRAVILGDKALETRIGAARYTSTHRPGLIHSAWMYLVAAGTLIALVLQAVVFAQRNIPLVPAGIVLLFSIAAGSAGAKCWFILKYRSRWSRFPKAGMCVQGFLLAATATAIASLLVAHLPVAVFMDAASPGLFVGLSIGRVGCFFVGCCAGRASKSRWAVWSSDGRLGMPRVPTQLLEAASCFLIGWMALFLQERLVAPGLIFLLGWGLYTVVRELIIFPRRARRPQISMALGAPGVQVP